jgi:hypothetical protein
VPTDALHVFHGRTRFFTIAATAVTIVLTSHMPVLSSPSGPPLEASPAQQRTARPSPRKPAPARKSYEEYQVPAGNTLSIELRSRLSSSANQPSDHVEGKLLRPLVSDGVELVPAGATVIGTISETIAAGRKKPGRIAFTFHVIEHPETGSRATIKAAMREFESRPPDKGKVFADVLLEKGTDASVLLLAPLVVRLPIE